MFDEQEVKEAIFSMSGDKAPRPDGFPMAFFQRFWDLLKGDVMAFMCEFHSHGKLSKTIGASVISLVPKKNGVGCLKDFRPISLIGRMYKSLAKVLARRLQKIVPSIISSTQGAFMHDRQILDVVLVANECIHSRHKEGIPSMVCKVDLEKAYDRVDWNFLNYMMHRMGFGSK